jgi:two-component system OmpR family response regulator
MWLPGPEKAKTVSEYGVELSRNDVLSRRLLLVEDDLQIAQALVEDLSLHHFAVTHAANGTDGSMLAREHAYDVMVVDRLLPGMDGLTLIGGLREAGVKTPVLVLSALSAVDDRVKGLKAGGDDYLGKPYATAELVARLEALLRRPTLSRATTLTVGPLHLDLIERTITRAGRDIELLPREFRLLDYMVRSAGQVLTRDMLLEHVWHYRSALKTNLVDVHISNLRRKIDLAGETPMIISIRGAGFMIRAPE